MEKIMCDTDILIELFDRDGDRHRETVAIVGKIGKGNIIASSATLMELIRGVRGKEHRQRLGKNIKEIHFFPLTYEVTIRAVELLDTYCPAYGLGIPDALIAATAMELETKLFTYNIRDFHFIEELELYTNQILK